MTMSRSSSEIRYALQLEISGALDETYYSTHVEIKEKKIEGKTYSVKGTFEITPFLSSIVKRKGSFVAMLDENLKVVSLQITETGTTQQ